MTRDRHGWLFADDPARRAYARAALREASDGSGRVALRYGRPFVASEIDELAACMLEVAAELGQQLSWWEHPSGWIGMLTPAYGDPVAS